MWQRVTKSRPCPICNHHDWCSLSADTCLCICMRVGDGAMKQTRNGGFLHRVSGRHHSQSARAIELPKPISRHDLSALASNYKTAANPARLQRLADALGLSAASLLRLGIGWAHDHRAWSFPMTDAAGNVRGIRLRLENGRKFAVAGGREGLFIPSGLSVAGSLFITEGPTDCAALLDLGFAAVGRPCCTGGARLLAELVKVHRSPKAVIVADADEPGQRGADALASVLVLYAQRVRIITPPPGIKDARAWIQAGATAADVRGAVETAPIHKLSIATRRAAQGAA